MISIILTVHIDCSVTRFHESYSDGDNAGVRIDAEMDVSVGEVPM